MKYYIFFICMPVAFAAESFAKTEHWDSERFSDISQENWFFDNVKGVYELGLMTGYEDGTFRPDENITLAETVTVDVEVDENGAVKTAIEEYVALPEEERTMAKKYEIGMKHMRAALEKEKECGKRMADIEGKIEALLIEMGQDTSLVAESQAAYEEEKELKKAYYLGLHS